jgi:hypothetical protein
MGQSYVLSGYLTKATKNQVPQQVLEHELLHDMYSWGKDDPHKIFFQKKQKSSNRWSHG